MKHRSILRLAALAGALALAACSKAPPPKTAPVPVPVAVAESDIDGVQALLMQGDSKGAGEQLEPLLKREPMNPQLLLLRDSIAGDPQEQLGPVSYPYVVRPGETIEQLAERLLGNHLKAYQLARYNGLANPSALAAGQAIRIPGTPPRPKVQPAPERPSRSAPAAPRSKPAAPASAPAKPAANPAAAQRARSAGLAALNRGAVKEAVTQLQRANALDPGNAMILRDLQRAQRIAATVRARQ